MSERVLPEGWVDTTLGQVVEYGKAEKATPEQVDDDTWVLELEDIEKSSSRIIQRLHFSERQFKSTKNRFKKGDVLYGKLRPYLDKVVIAERDGVCTTEVVPLDARPNLDNRYLFYWLKSLGFLSYVNEVGYGVNMPRLGTKDGKAAPFVLAPQEEQKAIADKLDKLLAQVNNLKARLDAIPAILKRFRQSVLAKAVSGKLSEDWRGCSSRYVGGFPEEWGQESFSSLGELARGKSKHRPRNDPRLFGDKHPFIQTGEVANACGVISASEKYYSDFGLSQSRLFPKGTLCVTIAANIADTALLGIDACFPDSVVGFVPDDAKCDVNFVKLLIDVNKAKLEAFAPATAQKNINLKVLNSLSFPMPSLEEQTEIIRRVDQLFAFADQTEQQVANAQARVDKLTQSILAKAFRGELTAEWRAENPELIGGEHSAEALLERIKAEKAKQKPTKTRRGGRKATVTP